MKSKEKDNYLIKILIILYINTRKAEMFTKIRHHKTLMRALLIFGFTDTGLKRLLVTLKENHWNFLPILCEL